MLSLLQSFSKSRIIWVLLILTGIILEGCALYFQYYLRMDPCVNCVYERAAVATFVIAGIIGFLFPQFFLSRLIAILTMLSGSVFGLQTSVEHYNSVNSSGFGVKCKIATNFPDFLPLDQWLPWMFKSNGQCVALDWSFIGLSMPEWLIIIFVCGCAAAGLLLFSQFIRHNHRDYASLYR